MTGISPQSSLQVKSFCKNIGYSLPKVIWWGEEMAGASPLASQFYSFLVGFNKHFLRRYVNHNKHILL